jgi:hypothetical protein
VTRPSRTRARRLALLVGAALGLVLEAAPALAGGNLQIRHPSNPATILPIVWDARRLPIRWVLSEDGLPGSGIALGTLESEIAAAFDAWAALPTSAAAFTYGGRVDARDAKLDGRLGIGIDGRNLVTFTDPDLVFPPGVLALSLSTGFTNDTVVTAANADLDGDGSADLPTGTYAAGTIFDSDIAFNGGVEWAVSGADGTNDVRAVALHEVGHLLGLCHSAIRHAVMWPFLRDDVAGSRLPTPDDVAWVSHLYPDEPAHSAAFGRITGTVTNGINGLPVLGAHVYAVDPETQAGVVGAYTGDDGTYVLPGLAPGDWLVAIEPLDGDPPGTEPFRINEVVAGTLDTGFPDELYDADEGAVETDPTAASPIAVTAGAASAGVDLVTNTLTLPGANVSLPAGFSLFAWPVAVPAGTTAFDVLTALGGPDVVTAIDRFVPSTGRFERAEHVGGAPAGVDFPVRRGEGYAVYLQEEHLAGFTGATDCPALDLARGLNLIGVPCRPAGYSAFALLEDLGTDLEVDRVARFDPETGTHQVASYDAEGAPEGDDFEVAHGEGYLVVMRTPKGGVRLPSVTRDVAPHIAALSPGRGVPGTVVAIIGEGFAPQAAKNLVTFGGVPAPTIVATSTTVTAVVPGAAASGPVRVTVDGRPSNEMDFTVEPAVVTPGGDAEPTELVSGQSAQATLGADGEQDRYTFTALAGSVVTVTANATTPGVPNLVLALEDPFGAIATMDDDGGGGTEPRINNFVLTATGTHTIVVTNVPGSGTGGYRLGLTIGTRPAETQVSILSGDVQTGEPGSELDEPLVVFATGPTGAPLAGIPVTVVATEVEVEGAALAGPIEAGTIVVDTSGSGIVSIKSSLPNKSGLFDVQVAIPGAKPVSFKVAATSGRATQAIMEGNQQRGHVDTLLPTPIAVVLRTANGTAVSGAAVQFKVVSGGGTITPKGVHLSNGAGRVSATWKLGKLVSAPQIVAASVPGRSRPLLFEAFPEPGVAAKLVADKASFNRITLGTTILNAILVRALDAFGNPVPDVTVNYSGPTGLEIKPGIGPDGIAFSDFRTDGHGVHAAAVGVRLLAGEPTAGCSEFTSTIAPSIDEFGAERQSPYTITATIGGTSASSQFHVHVDMGPRLTIDADAAIDGAMGSNQPLHFQLERVERFDKNHDNDFRPDPFTCLTRVAVQNQVVHVAAHRQDGHDEAAVGLEPTRAIPNDVPTDGNGVASTPVTLGDVQGVATVVGNVAAVHVVFVRAQNESADFENPSQLTSGTLARVRGPRLVVDIADKGSGIDLHSVVAKLNGTAFFSGASPPGVLPVFPDRLEVLVGDRALTNVDMALVRDGAFDRVRLHYFPSRPKLQPTNNRLEVEPVVDRAHNPAVTPAPMVFTWP